MLFLISRLIIVLIICVVPLVARVPIERWGKDDSISIKLTKHTLVNGLCNVAIVNDAGWYYGIARDGYEHRPFDTRKQANGAYFPLHPLLWRAAATFTGEWVWSGMLTANLLCLAGFSFLWLLTQCLTESERMADEATLFAAFWPTSYFMMLPQTEPLFFVLVTASFLTMYRERWWLASIQGFFAFAGATRLNGLFLMPSFFMRWLRGERRFADLLKVLPIAGGIVAFMVYLWVITGNPFAFKDIPVAWGRGLHTPWMSLLEYIHRPTKIVTPWNPNILNFATAVLAIFSVVTCWKRGWRSLACLPVRSCR